MVAIVCMACPKDDEVIIENKLNGKWNLTEVTCECAPTDFKVGDHVWEFDLTDGKVNVANRISKPLQILETGAYDIAVTDKKITILSVSYDYYFEDGNLFLADRPESDGPLMKFTK